MAKRVSKRYAVSVLVAGVVMVGSFMVTNVSAQGYPEGMVTYWKFDEGSGNIAKDSVGANAGNIYGATWTTGQVDGALSFDGVDDYVGIGSMGTTPIKGTIELWMYPTAVNSYRNVFSTYIYGDNAAIRFEFGDNPIWPLGLIVAIGSSQVMVTSHNYGILTVNQWYHIVLTWDMSSNNVKGWLNGVQKFDTTHTQWPSQFLNVGIGTGWNSGSDRFFKGLIDEVAIYNRALTVEEIQQHYQSGLQGLGYETPPNYPPVVDAGPNITIDSMDIPYTKVYGTASDPDGDLLTYRWLIDAQGTEPVSQEGKATLDLANLLREGEHEAILEVSDGTYTVTDSMILTVDNSSPVVVSQVSGTYKIGDDVGLRGDVADYDGDTLTYKWYEDSNIYDSGWIDTYLGGVPVSLPSFIIQGGLSLGSHTIILEVEDGHNPPVIKRANIDVVDTEAPTLAPTAEPGILWPPNHKLVPVVIYANAQDNSGFVTLSASVSSSEPPDTDGDGNTIPDFTEPQVDQTAGIITLELRAERKGKGRGRIYTITITATDESNNSSQAAVEVVAPHDRGN